MYIKCKYIKRRPRIARGARESDHSILKALIIWCVCVCGKLTKQSTQFFFSISQRKIPKEPSSEERWKQNCHGLTIVVGFDWHARRKLFGGPFFAGTREELRAFWAMASIAIIFDSSTGHVGVIDVASRDEKATGYRGRTRATSWN